MTDPKEVSIIKNVIGTLKYEKKQAEELESWAGIFKFDVISNMQDGLVTSLGQLIEKLKGLIK